jgi:ketosteroid isomerase-like protein
MKIIIALVAGVFAAAQALASDETDVMAVVHQWIEAFNKGGIGLELCTDQISIMDDFPPYEWHGPGACSTWLSDFKALAEADKLTDQHATLGKPQQLYVTGDRAFFSASASLNFKLAGKPMKQRGSTETITLQKTASGWRVTGEAWASPSAAEPAKPRT